jgi:hypothetical protein
MMGATSGEGITNPSGAQQFIPLLNLELSV